MWRKIIPGKRVNISVRLYKENVDPPLVAFNLPCLSKPRCAG